MASDREIAANRKNARKSTGPQTKRGKAIVAKNALRHGLTAQEILAPGENRQVRMQVVARICIAFFCFSPTWIQQMQLLPNGDIEAIITPGKSDFGKGRAHWSLIPRNRNTLLVFDARLDFKFWLPSAIGPLLIQQRLEEEATLIAQGLERVAAQRFPN